MSSISIIILIFFHFFIQAPQQPTHFDRRKIDTTENLLPSKEWQEEQVKNFTEIRLKVARHLALVHKEDTTPGTETIKFPSLKSEHGWCTFCLGDTIWNELLLAVADSDEEEKSTTEKVKKSYAQTSGLGHPPMLKIISNLKQSVITRLIERHSEWAVTLEKVEKKQALWFYALMSAVEKPLHPDIESSLRSFVLVCSKQRSREKIISRELDLIICIVAKYFGQADLADN